MVYSILSKRELMGFDNGLKNVKNFVGEMSKFDQWELKFWDNPFFDKGIS